MLCDEPCLIMSGDSMEWGVLLKLPTTERNVTIAIPAL
jgi:hypothetical protein